MFKIDSKGVKNPNAKIPEYAHKTDAGADIFAAEEVSIQPNETKIVPTGIKRYDNIPLLYNVRQRS